MKNEIFYRMFGQCLTLSAILLAGFSCYGTFHGLTTFSERFLGQSASWGVATAGMIMLIILARKRTSYALFFVLFIAGWDRTMVGITSHTLLNQILAGLCFLFATITGLGIASERFPRINKILPQVLMAVLGIFFLLPVALIARCINACFSKQSKPNAEF